MYLFFDTETNGLPKKFNAHVHEVDNWPRLVQLSWTICDDDGDEITFRDFIIKPDGWKITKETSDIHGITQNKADDCGTPVGGALDLFELSIQLINPLVGHNIVFDKSIVGAEFIRLGREMSYDTLKESERICTMKKSTSFCNLRNGRRLKWPKLSELYRKLFSEDFEDAHNSLADVRATARCFFELKKLGVL